MLTSLSLAFLVARKAEVSTLMEQRSGQVSVQEKKPVEEGGKPDIAPPQEAKPSGDTVPKGDVTPSSSKKQ